MFSTVSHFDVSFILGRDIHSINSLLSILFIEHLFPHCGCNV